MAMYGCSVCAVVCVGSRNFEILHDHARYLNVVLY